MSEKAILSLKPSMSRDLRFLDSRAILLVEGDTCCSENEIFMWSDVYVSVMTGVDKEQP